MVLSRKRPKGHWEDDWPFLPDLAVFEAAEEPYWIGLYDSTGRKLYAIIERNPIGFVALKEHNE